MRKPWTWLAVAAGAVVLALGGWLSFRAASGGEPLRMGAVLPLTGDLSYLGITQRNSIGLAVDEANTKRVGGARHFQVTFEDSKGDAQQAVLLLNRLVSVNRLGIDKVYLTGCAVAAAPIAKRDKVLLDAGSMLTGIEDGSNFVFRLYQGVDTDAETLSDYLISQAGRQKGLAVGLLRLRSAVFDAMSESYLRPRLEKAGVRIVDEEIFDFGTPSFNDKMAKLGARHPTHLVIMTYATDLPAITRALDENGMTNSVTVMGGLDVAMADESQLPLRFRDHIVVSAPGFVLSPNEEAKAFMTHYRDHYGNQPSYDAAIGFDSTNLLLDAMARVGSDRSEDVRKALLAVRSYRGVLGDITMTPAGGITVPVKMARFSGTRLEQIVP